ncbi:hypothetical protein [Haloferula sp. BvORR071]|uniref:hypothetical protein n=1 Tax=Haloferula sp. BvORR071 TaxID=1396141 RepID=UPI002240F376|nr:hypothetical protein [Haloferula sp. BvORR071]
MKRFGLLVLAMIPVCWMALQAQEAQPEPPAGAAEADPFGGGGWQGDSVPRMVRVQVELIELSHEQLTDLLFTDEPQSADATPLRKRLKEMVRAGEAKMLETMIANSRSGEKTTVESIEELIYPTEYEPWELPNEVDAPDKPQGLTPSDREALAILVAAATPTSFETRNLGNTLEIEPIIGANNKRIDLGFTSDMVWHTGDTVWGERKDPSGNVCQISMPDFYSMRMSTHLTCIPGQYNLAGVLSPKNAKGEIDSSRKVMVFVRCQILEVK